MAIRAPLRWGLIGASDIAARGMVPALRRVGHDIIGVASGSAEHGSAFAKELDISMSTTEISELCSRTDVDAIYVSSVNEAHLAHVRLAASAGKHILCEKPVATSLSDARSLVAACATGEVVLAVNHHLPAAGTHRAIRSLVRDGAIGRVLSVEVRHTTLLAERLRGWRLQPGTGAGAVMDLSCHDASVVNALLGASARVATALTVRQGPWEAKVDDESMAVVEYGNDVLVQFHDSFTTPFAHSRLEIHGDAGSIRAMGVMTPTPDGDVYVVDANGERQVVVDDRRHPYDVTLEAFVDAVRDGGRPFVTGHDAVDALAVSLAIADSARQCVPVEVQHDTSGSPAAAAAYSRP